MVAAYAYAYLHQFYAQLNIIWQVEQYYFWIKIVQNTFGRELPTRNRDMPGDVD